VIEVRHDWTREEIERIWRLPMPELIFEAQAIHRMFHRPDSVQLCRLLSIKTGACPEDCAYCPQSAHYSTGVARQELVDVAEAVDAARCAKADGATRFCMGAAWREAPRGREFDEVLEMVRSVSALGLEVCCTLGMLSEEQAVRLKRAGLTAYNHNLDTSPEFYGRIISTRTYEDRLRTIAWPASRCVAAASWEWVKRMRTESDFSKNFRISILTLKAFRSICWFELKGHLSRMLRNSIL
jgi:biotin synthase